MVDMIKNKYQDTVWGYDPKAFFPVLYEGRLQNKTEFLAYKLRCLIRGTAW
jgi:hypothetical protein